MLKDNLNCLPTSPKDFGKPKLVEYLPFFFFFFFVIKNIFESCICQKNIHEFLILLTILFVEVARCKAQTHRVLGRGIGSARPKEKC